MTVVKLPIVIAIALISAVAGGAIAYVVIPNTDPEMKALLARQVELAEEEAAARKAAGKGRRLLQIKSRRLSNLGRPANGTSFLKVQRF